MNSSGPNAQTIAADDSIYVAGYVTGSDGSDLAVVHYLADGTLDTSFGDGGVATAGIAAQDTNVVTGTDAPCGMAIDGSGNIVVAGTATADGGEQFAVARFAPDGTLNSSFGAGGVVLDGSGGGNSSATAVAIQSDGGIVVAGSTGMYLAVVRYLPDGAEDPNFQQWNASGAIGSASSVVIQPNNMILVGGTFVGAQWYYYGVGARGGAASDGQAHQRQLQPGRGAVQR